MRVIMIRVTVMRVVMVEVIMIIILDVSKENTVVALLGTSILLANIATRPRGRGEGFRSDCQRLVV